MAMDDGDRGDGLAPVTYLPGVTPESGGVERGQTVSRGQSSVVFAESYWSDETADDHSEERAHDVASGDSDEEDCDGIDRESAVAASSALLARSLGRRGLSIAEARAKLRVTGLTGDEIDDVIEDFASKGWLDDAVFAEQLVHSATTRQDMGTKAVTQLLQKRMVARDIIDAVIAELPDDDAERAMEFAVSKARSLIRYDDDTAIRRLMGQLARRGFGGSVAGHAARTALAAARKDAGGGGVRFR